ncbi:MAG TPA: cytochrome c peroxidase [Candidatus Binataceae bacterium]
MSNARIWLCCMLLGCVCIASMAALANGQEAAGKLAQPKPLDQVGFPHELYGWLIPPDNPQTPAKVALGKELFFDKRLSEDNTQACSSCHKPDKGFTDQQPTSDGIHHQFGQRNAPTVLNAAFNVLQFWDGREPTLEEQAKDPITNPVEMGMKSLDEVAAKVGGIEEYQTKFKAVFNGPVTIGGIQQAIAAYERTQVTFNTPFDRFMAGDQKAINAQAKRGWSIYNGKGRCMSCHGVNPTQPLFSDNRFHNIGVSAHKSDFVPLARKALAVLAQGGSSANQLDQLAIQTDMSGLGRFLVTKDPHDIGGFRTMGLRNLLVTQPYFHDGSQVTLWDVVDHYNKGGVQNPFLDGGIVPLGLTEPEIDDLVVFLTTLTSPEYANAGHIEFEKQFRLSRTSRPQRDTAAAMGLLGRNGPDLVGPFGDIGPDQMPENPALLGGR